MLENQTEIDKTNETYLTRHTFAESRRGSPAEILAKAQQHRFVIQDFCPLPESLEWELGQRYYHERGNKAFLREAVPVPFTINNDGNLSRNAAEVFFASLVAAEREGSLEEQIFVLELGIGVGLFARYFLDTFRELCVRNNKDYYERLCYVAADHSERMLLDIARHGLLANHPGRYCLRLVDALAPKQYLMPDLMFPGQSDRPFRAVFLNYLLDSLPAAILEGNGQEVRQLYVRTCLARGIALNEYTELRPDELARLAKSSEPSDKRELMELYGLFTSEYDYQPVNTGELPYPDFALEFLRSNSGQVVYNYGAMQSLEQLLDLLHDQGFILINDYGQNQIRSEPERMEHQRFAGATHIGVNFPLLKAFLGKAERCQWIEPPEDSPHIFSRLLGCNLAQDTIERFRERFNKTAIDWLHEPANLAREYINAGRYEAAAAEYLGALERQPINWHLMGEVSKFLNFTLEDPNSGLEMVRAALALNPTCSSDLWNDLGDSLFNIGRFDEAYQAYMKALRINPNDIRARFNLAWIFSQQKDFTAALKAIAEALSLDQYNTYREGLLQKQAEILSQLDYRHRQQTLMQINRVGQHSSKPKTSVNLSEQGNSLDTEKSNFGPKMLKATQPQASLGMTSPSKNDQRD